MSNRRVVGDIGSGAGVAIGWFTAFNQWLPEAVFVLSLVATLMSIAWYVVQFFDWLKSRRPR